jgi:hypothetical protein
MPTARAGGLAELRIVVDTHEQYPYRFANLQATVVRRALPCGDYGQVVDGQRVRRGGTQVAGRPGLQPPRRPAALRLADLAALPRAAVIVEDRYSKIFAIQHARAAVVADGLAGVQVCWAVIIQAAPVDLVKTISAEERSARRSRAFR